jgi:UDP-galactopyranose mutase
MTTTAALPGLPDPVENRSVPRDLVCFSHLRWDYVYQRPNHLMARAARERRVYFIEEPMESPHPLPRTTIVVRDRVRVVTPWLPEGLPEAARTRALAALIDRLMLSEGIDRPLLWYYTPMALPWTRHLANTGVIFDSMDHLAAFRGAPPALLDLESELLERADLVFCGGASLHERMRQRHRHSHCFPSSVDEQHFGKARSANTDPTVQASIARPRVGYAGVIDERIDLELIDGVARARPDWQIVLIGPVAKIAPEDIPSLPNVHLLGLQPYADLPSFLAGWDVGWMPFARNDATRYISPTKTPEYLAAGLPVVSTSIRDVVTPYGDAGLVTIADSVDDTVQAIDQTMAGARPSLGAVDAFLSVRSWDRTWSTMASLIAALEQEVDEQPSAVDIARVPLTLEQRLTGELPRVVRSTTRPERRVSIGARREAS